MGEISIKILSNNLILMPRVTLQTVAILPLLTVSMVILRWIALLSFNMSIGRNNSTDSSDENKENKIDFS